MAKGDHTRVQDQINQQGTTEQNSQNAIQNQLYGQNLGFQNNYNAGAGTDFGTYNNLNQGYGNLLGGLESGQIGVGVGSTLPQQGQQQSYGQQQSQLPQFNSNMTADQAEQLANQYNAAAGLPPDQGNMWGQYWTQFGQSDPNYFNTKLLNGIASSGGNMSQWQGLENPQTPGGWGPGTSGFGPDNSGNSGGLNGALGNALGGFSDFASTGGLSPQDQQSLRDQSEAATRGVFQTGQSNLNQNQELQQFSPNYAAATAKMSRDMGYGVSQADIGTNASIAQMIQQGKLSGLQGMTGIGGLNNQAQATNINAELGALGGNTSLYGAAPGMGSTYGNQLLGSSGQLVSSQGNQNQIGGQLIQGQLGESNVPGDFQQGVGNVMSVLSPVAGLLSGGLLGGLGGGLGSGYDISTLDPIPGYPQAFANGFGGG